MVANSVSWLNACGSLNPLLEVLDTSSVWAAFHVVTESAAFSGAGRPATTAPAIVKITTIHQNRRSASRGRMLFMPTGTLVPRTFRVAAMPRRVVFGVQPPADPACRQRMPDRISASR